MVYRNQFVVAIKVAGEVLRELDGVVLLPFLSEYSILLKNLSSVRSLAKVSVDGTEVTDGSLILQPNSSLNLERSIKNGNLDCGNRFKFIERTQQIEKHRGIKVDDGLIRVEYRFEKIEKEIHEHHYHHHHDIPRSLPPRPRPYPLRHRSNHEIRPAMGIGASSSNRTAVRKMSTAGTMAKAGITVAGSRSDQRFVNGEWFATESHSDVIILRLSGTVGATKVSAPVKVKSKLICETCGKSNKGTSQFCSVCGTALSCPFQL